MTNHPGRKQPAWVADAEAVAAARIAATRWPDGDAVLMTRADVERLMRDSVVHGYGMGLRAGSDALSRRGQRERTD